MAEELPQKLLKSVAAQSSSVAMWRRIICFEKNKWLHEAVAVEPGSDDAYEAVLIYCAGVGKIKKINSY